MPGVQIYIDGDLVGAIERAGESGAIVRLVEPGTHRLRAWKPFFADAPVTMTLGKRGVHRHHFELEPVEGIVETQTENTPLKQKRGSLTLLTKRPGVRVVVGNRSFEAPTELTGMPAGPYELKVTTFGKRPRFVTVTVKGGRTSIVDLDAPD